MPAYEGGVRSSITVYLSFWDRVRLLFGARMVVYLDAKVEKDPGRLVSDESFVVIGCPPETGITAESAPRCVHNVGTIHVTRVRATEDEVEETQATQPDEPCKCGRYALKNWWAAITDAGNEGTDYK
jgi:hypothetical protein